MTGRQWRVVTVGVTATAVVVGTAIVLFVTDSPLSPHFNLLMSLTSVGLSIYTFARLIKETDRNPSGRPPEA